MSKTIFFGKEARLQIKNGIDKVSNAVKVTLGFSGRNVIISNPRTMSYSTKDGVGVISEIMLPDPVENAGALIIKGVARKQLQECGDGTTTATILAQELINGGLKLVDNRANPVELKKGIDKAVAGVISFFKTIAIPVNDFTTIKNVSVIAANNDEVLGDLIARAYNEIGKDGIIDIEDSNSYECKMEVVKGMQVDIGLMHPVFINNEAKMNTELRDAYVIIYDSVINTGQEMVELLGDIAKSGKALLLIAEDVTGEAMQIMATNKSRGFPFCCIKTPAYGDLRAEILQDIAVVTGGVVVSKTKGDKISKVKIPLMGRCEKIIVSRNDTILVNGDGDETAIDSRIQTIRERISQCEDVEEKKIQEKRLARIKGGVASIKIGGVSDIEIREKKDRVDDAIRATKAAMEEGIVAGAGTSFIRAIGVVGMIKGESTDEQKGIDLVKLVLEAPLRQILINAGKDPNKFVQRVFDASGNFGYDGKLEIVTDLIATGVIDPVKVCRFALENAASVAGVVITSEVLMVEVEDKVGK